MTIQTKQALIQWIRRGNKAEYVFFCQHHKHKTGTVDRNCFSQWYDSSFQVNGVWYSTAEHYMMAQKAQLFNDMASFKAIIRSTSPKDAKALGRRVQGYESAAWEEARFEIVVAGNLAKFSQNKALREFLLSTDSKILVEASPSDIIWGIGLIESDKRTQNPSSWPGQNLLGFALMTVRKQLANSDK